MTKKKAAILFSALVLTASLVIGGTLAYLTDNQTVQNTFTMGNVDISLSEPNWNDTTDGKNLLPGDTLVKDPIVAAVAGDSYMRVKMEIIDTATGNLITDTARINLILSTIYYDTSYTLSAVGTNLVEGTKYSTANLSALASATPASIIAGYDTNNFTFDTTRTADPAVRYYNYNGIFKASDTDKAVLFTNIVIPTDFANAQIALLGNYKITLKAEAIQSDNFTSAAEAFTALDAA